MAWKGPHGPRQAYLAFDSDVVDKEGVRAALERLAAHLRRRGAAVLWWLAGPGRLWVLGVGLDAGVWMPDAGSSHGARSPGP